MSWMAIGSALLMGMMLVFLWPRAKHMLENSRKAEPGEWAGVVIPLVAVLAFVLLLIQLV